MIDEKDLELLIRAVDISHLPIRNLIKRMAEQGNLIAKMRMEDVYRKENPCEKCAARGYFGADIDFWGCPNEGREKCPYCNGRGHSPDR